MMLRLYNGDKNQFLPLFNGYKTWSKIMKILLSVEMHAGSFSFKKTGLNPELFDLYRILRSSERHDLEPTVEDKTKITEKFHSPLETD